ncbi:MAG TPA: hypothetical protein VN285_08255 [Candidatus Deferrimicrobium sp.]|nr:hypothetical protein [Candidatus Deferrimicrobium sp.]
MNKLHWVLNLTALLIASAAGPAMSADLQKQLAEWRKGVWMTEDGSYTIYTDSHYFVVFVDGDSSSANVYLGASQVQYHSKGMARKQVLRFRQLPGGQPIVEKEAIGQADGTEEPMQADTTLFAPGVCHIKDGIIYDSITEATEEYILLATCNGDREKIYANGVAEYLPASGGRFVSYRVEAF